ncbi:glucokinase [Lederbergia galactosidilyticus]|uniref:ROK family protein n=1 Tax=Lederbergia galactosidilytica TaxID=217031 RepID=UPI001AE807C7|nr:ROK family protein [Lederbergia galactosidilytica]MBP1915486.1 glucokinase [Lederbergia galactosidilytica]
MTEEFYLCLDVGGTEIKVNLLHGNQVECEKYPSHAEREKLEILAHFESIVKRQLQVVQEQKGALRGIGVAFPGPFDYDNGISLIKGLRKYDALYQVKLKSYFQKWLVDMDFPANIPFLFENDAVAFSIGEYIDGVGQHADKVMFIMLGTGCGSTFIEKGEIVKNKYSLQENGMIYQDPFLDGTIEDYLSANGLKMVARQMNMNELDGLALYQASQKGSQKAQDVFYKFGYLIGTALQRYVQSFQPDCIAFGGQIAGSMKWMKPGIQAGLGQEQSIRTKIKTSENGTLSTCKGLVYLLNQKK